jgi:hypothetical protein
MYTHRYEHRLKQLHPSRAKITYDISDLFTFIDTLPDLRYSVTTAEQHFDDSITTV